MCACACVYEFVYVCILAASLLAACFADARLRPLQPTVMRAPWCRGVDSSSVASQSVCGRVEHSSSCRSASIFLAVVGLAALQSLHQGKPWRQQVLQGIQQEIGLAVFVCVCVHARMPSRVRACTRTCMGCLRTWLHVRACVDEGICHVMVCMERGAAACMR